MKYWTCFFIFFFFYVSAFSQVKSERRSVNNGSGRIHISVVDSLSGSPLHGATLMIVSGRDTSSYILGNLGQISIYNDFKSDSLELVSSFVGFKPRRDFVKTKYNQSYYITIGMQEDVALLTSVTVTADAVSIVMKGDTTVFNKAAFSTREGDYLKDLLKKMPGMEIQSDGVTFKGEKIDKILVNGQYLFGKNTKDALSMVLADEVKSVKVYNAEPEKEDNVNLHTKKEKVLDISTWNPFNHILQFRADLARGVYYKSENNLAGGVSLFTADYSTLNKPNISAQIDYRKNISGFDGIWDTSNSPIDDFKGEIQFSRKTDRYNLNSTLAINNFNKSDYSSFKEDYYSSSLWRERRDTSCQEHYSKSFSISQNADLMMSRKSGRWIILENVSYQRLASNNRNFMCSSIDGIENKYDKSVLDTTHILGARVGLRYNKTIDRKIFISAETSISSNIANGRGSRRDDWAESARNELFESVLSQCSVSPDMRVSLSYRVGNKSSLGVRFNSSYSFKRENTIWNDLLKNHIDMNNSKHYKDNNLSNSLSVSYDYGRGNDRVSMSSSGGNRQILILRTEFLGNLNDFRKQYFRPTIAFNFQYSGDLDNVMISYSESEFVPRVVDLRSVIDDSNPLFLKTGNPELKLPVKHTFNAQYYRTLPSLNMVLGGSARVCYNSNVIGHRILYYPESTYLDRYNYTIDACSSIQEPVNFDNSLFATSSLSSRFTYRQLYCDFSFGGNISTTPYYIGSESHNNMDRSWEIGTYLGFSPKWMDFSISTTYSPGTLFADGSREYEYEKLSITCEIKKRIGPHIELSASVDDSRSSSDKQDVGYHITRVNGGANVFLGKDNCFKISIFARDLLNSKTNYSTIVSELSVARKSDMYMGSLLGLSLSYTFNKR